MPVREVPQKFKVAFSFAGEERELVRAIAEAVELLLPPTVENGKNVATVFLDEWFTFYLAGNNADLKLQEIYSERSELVVVGVSEKYGSKSWTTTEHESIRSREMKLRESKDPHDKFRILPIQVGTGEVPGIPFTAIVPKVSERPVPEIAEMICQRLQLILPDPITREEPTVPLWPKEPIAFKHGLADRTVQEWPAVLKLLTADATKRILVFQGPSGYSKSALLGAAAKYARALRAPVAYVDFKDTKLLNEANVLREIQSGLGLLLGGSMTQKDPDRWALRQALKASPAAALILFDTYEKAVGTKELIEWIETHLCPQVEECEHLRFVIGGQQVPDFSGTLWEDFAEEVELDRIHDQSIWKTWVHEINPNVDDKHVEAFVKGFKGVPADISGTLKTLAQNLAPPVVVPNPDVNPNPPV